MKLQRLAYLLALALCFNGHYASAQQPSAQPDTPSAGSNAANNGSARDGKVTTFIPDPEGSQEGVAADAKGNIYGSLTGGMALKKYVLAP